MSSKCEQCIVRKISSLNALTKEELIRVSNCKVSKSIEKGEVLFDEGDHINGVYCIKSGIGKITKMSSNGKDQIIKLIKQGDIVGERSLVTNEASNLKATSVQDLRVCFIPKEEILKDLQSNSNFSMKMLQKLAVSLKEADNIIVDMAQKSVKQRLAECLLYLNENFPPFENQKHLNIQLSREEIANIIGTATESVIRLLSDFKKRGLIELNKKNISILDHNTLQHIADGY